MSYEVVEDPRPDAELLAEVAAGRLGPIARVYRPAPTVSFGRLDVRAPGFEEACRRARAAGFEPERRIAGGRAAAYHRGSVVVELFAPQDAVAEGLERRFEEITALIVDCFSALGVEVAVGELPGEYCPGRFSVHAGGLKLAGTAQRSIRGAALAGAFVAVEGGETLRAVLAGVYDALGLDWDPRTAGAAEDVVPGVTAEDYARVVREALIGSTSPAP